MKKTLIASAAVLAFGIATPVLAHMHIGHDNAAQAEHNAQATQAIPTETGQSAFAAIAEIVALLQADPNTDWDQVNFASLRAHLVDMNAVTLLADVAAAQIDGGAVFEVASSNAKTTGSIRRMLLAHGNTMSGVEGFDMASVKIDGGARITVTGPNPAMIRGLGFFGVMTLGMHHQPHHLALALGQTPHL